MLASGWRYPYLSYAPVLLAKAEGYFAEQGIEVELVPLGRSEQILAALLSGEVDVWPGTYTPGFLRAMALGGRLRVVGDKGYLAPEKCTYVGIVLRKGIQPAEARDKLRRMNRSREGFYAYVMSRMLSARGIDEQRLEFAAVQSEVVPEALADGVLDAAGTVEPFLSRATQAGTLWLRAQDVLPGYQWGILLYGRRLLTTNRELGVRFMAAYRRGTEQANLGQTPHNLDVLSRATGMTVQELQATCWPTFRADGRIQLAGVLDYQAWARARGLLDTVPTPDQLYDSSFVVASDRILRQRHD